MTTTIPETEILSQREAMDTLRALFAQRSPLAFVDTYGCQQNEADSERIRGVLLQSGCVLTDSAKNADIVVVNTCSVREHAETKVFGVIGSFLPIKRERPDMIVIVCGCMAQREGAAEKLRQSYKHVDLVFGPHALHKLPSMLLDVVTNRHRVFDTAESDGVIAEGLPKHRDGKYKAWLSVMYGCNNFCSYCVVPYVRGRERSREYKHIEADMRDLLEQGALDITLLGQNVNSYGGGSPDFPPFPELLRRLAATYDREYRVRFMTSHPKDASDELFRVMAETPNAGRCRHLPFQSGSSRVLDLMNRRYTREKYLSLIKSVRDYMPDIVLTSDVIVGFPGETLQDFEETMSLIEEVRFDALFTFIYSPRPGAPSALQQNNTPKEEIQRRFERLVDRQNQISEEKHAEYVGRAVRVLIDGKTDDEDLPYTARTSGNRLVRLKNGTLGTFADVKITGSNRWSLTADNG